MVHNRQRDFERASMQLTYFLYILHQAVLTVCAPIDHQCGKRLKDFPYESACSLFKPVPPVVESVGV